MAAWRRNYICSSGEVAIEAPILTNIAKTEPLWRCQQQTAPPPVSLKACRNYKGKFLKEEMVSGADGSDFAPPPWAISPEQNIGQPKSFEPFAPDARALTSEFEENIDDRKHTLDQR